VPAKNAYLDFVTEQLSVLGSVSSRPMMGGYCLYCDGFVFALLAGNALYLKADDRNRAQFENRGLKPFRPFDGPGTMSYYEAPPEIFEDPDAMRSWCAGSIDAGRLAAEKRLSKKKSKGAKA
jgi:DNA transformation protein